MSKKLNVKGRDIAIVRKNDHDYISLTDIAKHKTDESSAVIANWMRNRNTLEFLGVWETLYNPDFNPLEFEGFKKQAGLNAFTLSPQKWMHATNAIGFMVKAGRYGGTFAHLNVALFGITAKEWRDTHPEEKGNIRDYATIEQLVVLSNLESINAMLIHQGLNQSQRITQLNAIAITQMRSLLALDNTQNKLESKHD